jgi:exonuclease III
MPYRNDLNCNNFVILNQNIRSLRSNFNLFLNELDGLESTPDIIVLTEIWITNVEIDFYKIPGYNLFCHCNESYRAGGVAVYCRDSWPVCDVTPLTDIKSADCLLLTCVVGDARLSVLAVYRLQSFTIDHFTHDLEHFLSTCRSLKNFIIASDSNINILLDTNEVNNFLGCLASFGFKSVINEPTRIVGNSISCIDHIFIRCARVFFG